MKLNFRLSPALVALLMIGCGQNGMQVGGSNGNANNNSGQGLVDNSPAAQANWQKVADGMNSSASGGSYDGDPMIVINKTNQTLELILPIPAATLGGVTPIIPSGIPGLPGVSVGPAAMPDGSEAWMVSVPLSLILKGASLNSTFNTLPNGSPLPYFPSQEVDGISVTLPSRPNYSVTLYIGVKAVAVFVGIPALKTPVGFSLNVVNSSKTRTIGDLALIPTKGNFPAGIYLAAQVPTDIAQILNSLIGTN